MSRTPSLLDPHGDVVDAHHFAAGDVDDLLVQQVAPDAQHVLVVVVRDEHLVAEEDALGEADGADLIVADGEPGIAAAHQQAVDAGGADQRDQGGIFDPADAPALEVQHRHGQQLREVQEVVRQWKRTHPKPIWRKERHAQAELFADQVGEPLARDRAHARAHLLRDDENQGDGQQRPQGKIAEARAGGRIGEDAARIVIDVGGDKPRPQDREEDQQVIAEAPQEFQHPSLLP